MLSEEINKTAEENLRFNPHAVLLCRRRRSGDDQAHAGVEESGHSDESLKLLTSAHQTLKSSSLLTAEQIEELRLQILFQASISAGLRGLKTDS